MTTPPGTAPRAASTSAARGDPLTPDAVAGTRETEPDHELVARVARQEFGALDALYARYGRIAFSVAHRVLGDFEAAEDVVQEVFLTVWRRAHTYAPDRGSVRTWLLSITRNRAIDVARGRAARPHGVPLDDILALPAGDDPAAEALRRIEATRVRAALERLPAAQRGVIELAFFSGFSYPEIAARIGIPLGTVKSRIRLALERLRVVLLPDVSMVLACPE
jgi:RNA polymerase sigma-70 factor, ECF subfamily